jgi:hypothetical protein
MEKKIVIVPGVGFQSDTNTYNSFAKKISEGSGCSTELFYWHHSYPTPSFNLSYELARIFIAECLLDFQYVLMHEQDIVLPDADYYIGHSAGSLMILSKTTKPSIIMGSPALLIEKLNESNNILGSFSSRVLNRENNSTNRERMVDILNIVNAYDVLAYPLSWANVKNVNVKGSSFLPSSYNPVTAHTSYWNSKDSIKATINQIKDWGN